MDATRRRTGRKDMAGGRVLGLRIRRGDGMIGEDGGSLALSVGAGEDVDITGRTGRREMTSFRLG